MAQTKKDDRCNPVFVLVLVVVIDPFFFAGTKIDCDYDDEDEDDWK